jgi:retinol dehydrogenase-12
VAAHRKPGKLDGKTCLVTGATSGIGRATAEQLAGHGALVVMVAHNEDRGGEAVNDVLLANPDAKVELLVCDLSLMTNVRSLADQVTGRYGALDVLINNAGVSKFSREVTTEGLETTFAVNHLAPFLLTNLLLPALKRRGRAQVVNVTSEWHVRIKTIPWDDLQREHAFKPTEVYESTKLMNIWFTRALARRLADTAITTLCVAPGFIHTNLTREARGGFGVFLKMVRPFQKPPSAGAHQIVRAVTGEMSGPSGAYFKRGKVTEPSDLARNDDLAYRLWEVSADLCGLSNAI